jgi:signal transduction histidine kinase
VIDTTLKRLDTFFERRSNTAILLFTLVLAVAIGVLDYFTAPDLLLLYLGPIFVAAWYGEWRTAAVVAIYSAGSAYVTAVVMKANPESPTTEIGNLLVHLVAYLTIARVVSRLRESRRQTGFIVHDLRAPIANAISGLLSVKQSCEHLDDTEREMVDMALVSSQRAVTLVNSLLDVAKLETGNFDIEKESVSLDLFIASCFEQVELWARGNDIKLEKQLSVAEAVFDRPLTERVLVNLLSNALKFSPTGTTVSVRARISNHALQICVDDEGPGIPKDLLKSVFEPYTQVKRADTGTGLGLAFCRLAVNAQHGAIWIDPDMETGTSVCFSIPQPRAPEQARGSVPQPTEV